MRSAATWLLAVWLALAGAAAAAEPARPGQRPPPGSDEDELWYAMDRAERELQQHPQRVRDEALNAYVHDVACRIAADFCADLRVYVIEEPWFNASMAPNGMLIVWTGALLRFQDEAELALVLGHEFAHFRQRHSLEQWRKTKRTTAVFGSLGLLAFGGGAGLAGEAIGIVGAAALTHFSRDAEREADRLGFAAALAQGYDPQAGVRVWQRMKAEEDARSYGKPSAVFASHPRTAERLADVAEAARAAGGAGGETRQAAYRDAVRPFMAGWLEDELSRRMYDTSIRVIGDLRPHADPALQATFAFYLGEAWRRRGKPGDAERAEALVTEALSLPDPPPAAWRERGLALRRHDDAAGAAEALHRYLALAPGAEDRAFIEQYLAELESP